MPSAADLKALERKVFTSFHEDGIIDIFAGLLLLVDGFLLLSGNPEFVGPAVVIIFLIPPVKKMVTVPRIGLVNFSSQRNIRQMRLYLVTLVVGLLVFLVFLLNNSSESLTAFAREYYALLLGLIFVLMAGMAALLTGVRRFVWYMAGILVLFIVGQILGWEFPVTQALTGGMLFLTGVITLIRFVKKYPKTDIPEEV